MFDALEAIRDLVRQPSVSTDPAYLHGMAGAREVLLRLFAEQGLEARVVSTDRHPAVIAQRSGPSDWPHVLVYGHYDVQPPDPLALWETPPWEPVERGGRLYGRGAADNKGPLMVHVAAAFRLLARRPDLPLRLTFLIEGEEEIGSPSFARLLKENADLLRADFVLLSDTLSPSEEQIAVTTGLRGLIALEVVVKGPKGDLHSGLHGGAVHNPIQALMEILASLHGPDNRVLVPGFYEGIAPVEPWEREEIARLGLSAEAYAATLGVPGFHTVDGLSPFEATRLMPTLEFNGITGGYQGQGEKTIIPSEAAAKITCRLVAGQDPRQIEERVAETIRARCPATVRMELRRGHSGPPYRVVPPGKPDTPPDQPVALARAFEALDTAVTEVFGRRPLYLREGGSVPIIGEIKRLLGMDSLMLGMFTPESNLHAPNESLHIGMFEKGVTVSERLLEAVAAP